MEVFIRALSGFYEGMITDLYSERCVDVLCYRGLSNYQHYPLIVSFSFSSFSFSFSFSLHIRIYVPESYYAMAAPCPILIMQVHRLAP